jgi:hypothetical protein
MTSPTLTDSSLMRTRTKRAVREFKPKLWLDGSRVPANVVVNGGFEATAGAGTFDSWSEDLGGASTVVINTAIPDSGTNCCELSVVGGALAYIYQNVLTVGVQYTVRFRAKCSSGAYAMGMDGSLPSTSYTLDTNWTTYETTFTAADVGLSFKRLSAGTHSIYIDNVTCWKTSETPTNAATIPQWMSRDVNHTAFANTAVASHPTYTAATKSVTFAGTNDYLTKATATLTGATTSLNSVYAIVSTSVENAEQVIIAQSDTASATRYLQLGISVGNQIHYKFNNGGTADELRGTTVLGTGVHILEWRKTATAIELLVDNGLEPVVVVGGGNNGKWFGDITGADNTTIGAKVDSTGVVATCLTGSIQEIVALEPDDTALNATRLRKTLARLGSVTLASGIGIMLANGSGILLTDGSGLLLG